jgi:hypothetical protein
MQVRVHFPEGRQHEDAYHTRKYSQVLLFVLTSCRNDWQMWAGEGHAQPRLKSAEKSECSFFFLGILMLKIYSTVPCPLCDKPIIRSNMSQHKKTKKHRNRGEWRSPNMYSYVLIVFNIKAAARPAGIRRERKSLSDCYQYLVTKIWMVLNRPQTEVANHLKLFKAVLCFSLCQLICVNDILNKIAPFEKFQGKL